MNTKSSSFNYPHPLIKNITQSTQIGDNYLPSSKFVASPSLYQNFTFDSEHHISPKLLRKSKSKVAPSDEFGILLQPFNPVQDVAEFQVEALNAKIDDPVLALQNELKGRRCTECSAFFNNRSIIVSHDRIKCILCGKQQKIRCVDQCEFKQIPVCWDYKVCPSHQSRNSPEPIYPIKQKNICFVIELSEYNYNFRVHESIWSCLQALKTEGSFSECFQADCQSSDLDLKAKVSEKTIHSRSEDQKTVEYRGTEFNVGFIFFNDTNVFVLNQQSQELIAISEHFMQGLKCGTTSTSKPQPLLKFTCFMRPLEAVSQQTFNLMNELLYESFLSNTSCLQMTTHFIADFVDQYFYEGLNTKVQERTKKQISFKYFINNVRSASETIKENTADQIQHQEKSRGIFGDITNGLKIQASNFLNKTDKSKSSRSSIPDSSKKSRQPSQEFNLCPNYTFFVIPSSPNKAKASFAALKHRLHEIYTPQSPFEDFKSQKGLNNLFNHLYYDLYQNLTEDFAQVEVTIITSPRVKLLSIGNAMPGQKGFQGFHKKLSIRDGKSANSYTFFSTLSTMKNCTIPITSLINPDSQLLIKKGNESEHNIQIQVKQVVVNSIRTNGQRESGGQYFTKELKIRNFDFSIFCHEKTANLKGHTISPLSTYVDDEVLCYFLVRNLLQQIHTQKDRKQRAQTVLLNEIRKIADQFRQSYGMMTFPKEYRHLFLYSFMLINSSPILNSSPESSVFLKAKHRFINSPIESFSRAIYPRVYQLDLSASFSIKNVKASPNQFMSDSITLVDNNQYLFIVVGEDVSVAMLKALFGTCFLKELSILNEIPDLNGNESFKEAVESVRALNESHYLTLRVVELFGVEFEHYISPILYNKEKHFKFMRRLWDLNGSSKRMA